VVVVEQAEKIDIDNDIDQDARRMWALRFLLRNISEK